MSGADKNSRRAYIGLGSNLGDRMGHIQAALKAIEDSSEIDIVACSGVSDTSPVDNLDQPDYLNQVISVETSLSPHNLLGLLQSIEISLGRERNVWKGPRTIDLDILLYDDCIVDNPRLTIPHPELLNRAFLVEQILEIDADALDPVSRLALASLLRAEEGGGASMYGETKDA